MLGVDTGPIQAECISISGNHNDLARYINFGLYEDINSDNNENENEIPIEEDQKLPEIIFEPDSEDKK